MERTGGAGGGWGGISAQGPATDPYPDADTNLPQSTIISLLTIPGEQQVMLKVRIAEVLKEEGFIKNYKVISDNLQGILRVYLKYIDEKDSVINEIKRVSKPGGRVYVKAEDIPVVKSGLGVAVLSTSKGVITDSAARKAGVGGELICTVW